MHDLFVQALNTPGLGLLLATCFVSGLVRGFAGFGTALIFIPIAAQIVPPVWAILILTVMDIAGPMPSMPRAFKEGHPKDLMRLMGGTILILPLGLWVLLAVDPIVFKVAGALVSLAMLAVLVTGWRYRGQVTPKMVWATGGAAGFLGGAAGIPGPPVILFYMASPHGPRVIRANNTAFLFLYDLVILTALAITGQLVGLPIMIGVLAILPVMLGNLIGARMFDPAKERLYRSVAYVIIAGSSLSGLYAALS